MTGDEPRPAVDAPIAPRYRPGPFLPAHRASMTTRLRFAPSPTGALHLGGARTALFNWLYARHTGGQFLIRIEDTDQDRNTADSFRIIREGLAWLGIDADEEPLVQSTRFAAHVEAAHGLLASGHAYRCYCTTDELEAMREQATAEGRKPKYDGRCRARAHEDPAGRPHVIRFKVPDGQPVTWDDMVLGPITFQSDELDDLVILRSDDTPTYNFVVVCDDAFMRITHVVRGQDHVSNTPRQILLYEAMGQPLPRFAHLPMVDGLSKRKGSAGVTAYRDNGFVAEAVINYIARLGWSHGDQEIFDVEELIALFDLADVNRASGAYDEVKLAWVNQQWMKRLPAATLAERLVPYLADRGVETVVDDRLIGLAAALQERSHNLLEMADGAVFAFRAPEALDEKAVAKFLTASARPAVEALLVALRALPEFDRAGIEGAFQTVLELHPIGMGKLAQPVRVALTGTTVSPPIFEALVAVGRDESLRRIEAALPHFAAE